MKLTKAQRRVARQKASKLNLEHQRTREAQAPRKVKAVRTTPPPQVTPIDGMAIVSALGLATYGRLRKDALEGGSDG